MSPSAEAHRAIADALEALALAAEARTLAEGTLAVARVTFRVRIREAREAGATLEDIGRAAGLSRQRIVQLIAG